MREKASVELIFINSGLQNKAGHIYSLAKTVSEALARRRLRCRIFGLSGLDPSIAAEIGTQVASNVAGARARRAFGPTLDNLRTLLLCCRWVAIYNIAIFALACARV
jgi:hypothetical protein